MEQHKTRWREPALPAEAEQLLADYYSQLLKWGAVLTRGDEQKAADIVQELCLYFILTKPDLSTVTNLDGYFYTSLRHIYLSGLARASREALHFVSVADFDSFEFALASNQSGDPLQRQNDLRRICGYNVWRKGSSKSASYFIFHFFHGYSRREIAELARLPISAIYNKLKTARSEVTSYLNESGKLRTIGRGLPPEPVVSWSLSSTGEMFKELRQTVLDARRSECLPAEALIAKYRTTTSIPIDCTLLAHLVSCEDCLAIIDRHFRRPTLRDREPLDGSAGGDERYTRQTGTSPKILQSVLRRWGSVNEHRPRTLSIAINGKIVAFHDVQASHSTLSARIEHALSAQFVEVFSEQDVRLALLSVGDHPPDAPHIRAQRVSLSDDRWLELRLVFDGLGLDSQVTYSDPALAVEVTEDAEDVLAPSVTQAISHSSPELLTWVNGAFGQFLRKMVPTSAGTWAFALTLLIVVAGYIGHHRTTAPVDAANILNQSISIDAAALHGQTEHQIVNLEEVSVDGQVSHKGQVDLLQDGDGTRYLRRLYNSQHHLIAATWRDRNGEHATHVERQEKGSSGTHSLSLENDLWNQELSARAFSSLKGQRLTVKSVADGYELTNYGPVAGYPQLVSATLRLNRHFGPVVETFHLQGGHELRFVQTSYERRPTSSIPDTTFDPAEELQSPRSLHSSAPQRDEPTVVDSAVQLARLQIAVLYKLNTLGSDTGEPIEVVRTSDGRIRVSGTVVDDSLKQQIASELDLLEEHQLLDLRLTSPRDVQQKLASGQRSAPEDTSVYEVSQTKPLIDATIRRYLQAKGVSADRLNTAVEQYSHTVLQHAQRVLQHAYALNRLGSALSANELKSVGPSYQRQWTEMVRKHATDLENELLALRRQLAEIAQPESAPDTDSSFVRIENSDQFHHAANQLLRQTQDLNKEIGKLFTSNASGETQPASASRLAAMMSAIPLRQAEEINHFAVELETSERSTVQTREDNTGDKGSRE
jgi:DNA-directed RNA polymerase specialized sigma24 family protein